VTDEKLRPVEAQTCGCGQSFPARCPWCRNRDARRPQLTDAEEAALIDEVNAMGKPLRTAEASLLDELVHVAIVENDRAVKQALRGEREPTTGALWETCFRQAFSQVLQRRESDQPDEQFQRLEALAHACGQYGAFVTHHYDGRGRCAEETAAIEAMSDAFLECTGVEKRLGNATNSYVVVESGGQPVDTVQTKLDAGLYGTRTSKATPVGPRGKAGEVSVVDLSGDGSGPWRLFIGVYGVADWPAPWTGDENKEYAEEVARCVRVALRSEGAKDLGPGDGRADTTVSGNAAAGRSPMTSFVVKVGGLQYVAYPDRNGSVEWTDRQMCAWRWTGLESGNGARLMARRLGPLARVIRLVPRQAEQHKGAAGTGGKRGT